MALMAGGDSPIMAEPIKIVKLMYRAATDKNPKHRYLPGFFEKTSVFLARKLPVRWFDAMVLRLTNG